jgi:hypothetical protein
MKLPIHKDQDFERLVADFVFILQEVKRTKPWANHTYMVEKFFPTPNYSSTFSNTSVFSKEEINTHHCLFSQLETFVGGFTKEEVDTLFQFLSLRQKPLLLHPPSLPIQVTSSCL